MRVRMLKGAAGPLGVLAPGQEYDIDADLAERWAAAGVCVAAPSSVRTAVVETAVDPAAGAAERAVTRMRRAKT